MEMLKDPSQWLPLAIEYGTALALAIVIFYVGRLVVGRIVSVCHKVMLSRGTDETLVNFVCSILRWVGLLFVTIAALSRLGVDTTSLVALLGAAGLAIGLSLQSSLGNFAAGVMLIVFKPFKKGDFIEAAGTMGTVDTIGIFTTTMTTPDNKEIIVPNGGIIGGNITNFSARATRRVDMVFGISYGDNLHDAKTILEDIIKSDSRVLAEPEAVVTVGALADSSVNFLVRPWVNAADYWGVLWDTTEAVKLRFDEAGISIPFPQMELHMQRPEDAKAEEAKAE
ncbi:mechanosensitive ion channel family protein [Congregibacter litoralis]|uniref:Small-conductance mechanosensitive channel n=1 Tax=Congregibacter litoralis KT71 TaxID=314285 RepID=A4ACK0_9GAMM|nr:mechanosensitive ion channel domain-containing protein [Congregibacter litoralis]EAQ96214.2 Small-conductance mechanosensitive channel [Congregibacter litoralis KT71]